MTTEASYPFEQANKYHPGRVAEIEYIVIHCTAGLENASGRSAKAVQDMFAHNTRDASAHVTVDQVEILRSVHDWDTAWAVVYFNANGLHLEIVGLDTQSEAQWLDAISMASLRNGARVVADWCKRHGIPTQYRTIDELRRGGIKGITFHMDCEKAKPSTGHTDPGPGFPRDLFLTLVRQGLGQTPTKPPAARPGPSEHITTNREKKNMHIQAPGHSKTLVTFTEGGLAHLRALTDAESAALIDGGLPLEPVSPASYEAIMGLQKAPVKK